MNDQELTAEARRVAVVLRDWPSADARKYAAGLLAELADRLDGRAAAQATEDTEDTEDVHVIREGTIAGPLILDPRYAPWSWPGAGVKGDDQRG